MKVLTPIITTVLLLTSLSSFCQNEEHILDGAGCGRGYVDTIVKVNGNHFHLLYRVYIDDTTGGYPERTYTDMLETKDDPEAYNNLVAFCQSKTGITFRPDNIALYTTDSALNPIVAGDFNSVVGISIWRKHKRKVVHTGYVLENDRFISLGDQKLLLDDESRVTLWDIIYFLVEVRKYHIDADAYFLIGSKKHIK